MFFLFCFLEDSSFWLLFAFAISSPKHFFFFFTGELELEFPYFLTQKDVPASSCVFSASGLESGTIEDILLNK